MGCVRLKIYPQLRKGEEIEVTKNSNHGLAGYYQASISLVGPENQDRTYSVGKTENEEKTANSYAACREETEGINDAHKDCDEKDGE